VSSAFCFLIWGKYFSHSLHVNVWLWGSSYRVIIFHFPRRSALWRRLRVSRADMSSISCHHHPILVGCSYQTLPAFSEVASSTMYVTQITSLDLRSSLTGSWISSDEVPRLIRSPNAFRSLETLKVPNFGTSSRLVRTQEILDALRCKSLKSLGFENANASCVRISRNPLLSLRNKFHLFVGSPSNDVHATGVF